MPYQDRWVRGTVTTRGDRACADRYDIIRAVVDRYRRPVTVWDLGANLGYFGCRLSEEYDAVSVMVEPRPALVEVCRENALPRTLALTHRLTARDVAELAKSEHADVVLALNVLHHCEDWREWMAALLKLGECVVIETPGPADVGSAHYERAQEIRAALEAMDTQWLGEAESHVTPGVKRPLWLLEQPKTAVETGYAYGGRVRARGPHPARPHTITSTAITKQIAYADGEAREWVPGMNLWNWLQLGGSYPDRQTVKQAVQRAYQGLRREHGDFKPWNLILQGQTVQVIDGGHRHSCADAEGLRDTLAWIDQPERAYVQ